MVRLMDYYETNEHKMEHCPFCHQHTLQKWIDDTNRYFVRCANCGAETAPKFKPQDATNEAKWCGNYIKHGEIQPVEKTAAPKVESVPNVTKSNNVRHFGPAKTEEE